MAFKTLLFFQDHRKKLIYFLLPNTPAEQQVELKGKMYPQDQ